MSFSYPTKKKQESFPQLPSCAYGNVLDPDCSPTVVADCCTGPALAEAVKQDVDSADVMPVKIAESVQLGKIAPADQQTASPGRDTFITGLCKSGGPCCEACCCYPCQLSRQYNMLVYNVRGLSCGVCCLVCCLECPTLHIVGACCQCYLRDGLRRRYRLAPDGCGGCGDCCTVFWCPCCALSQTHWEMAMRGDDPGASMCGANVTSSSVMR